MTSPSIPAVSSFPRLRALAHPSFAATQMILLINTIVFAIECWDNLFVKAGIPIVEMFRGDVLVVAGAKIPGGFVHGILPLVSACFVHGNVLHFAMNMAAIAALGRDVEPTLGSARLLRWYLLFGVLSIGLSTTIQRWMGDEHMVCGASGAGYGLIGVFMVLLARRGKPWRLWLAAELLVAIPLGLFTHIGVLAHLAGLACGASLAWWTLRSSDWHGGQRKARLVFPPHPLDAVGNALVVALVVLSLLVAVRGGLS